MTAILVVSLSPGYIAAGVVSGCFVFESLFIVVKQPYILRTWKRPLINKIISVVICGFYVAASMTSLTSKINQFIPLAILVMLFAVLTYSTVFSVYSIKSYW